MTKSAKFYKNLLLKILRSRNLEVIKSQRLHNLEKNEKMIELLAQLNSQDLDPTIRFNIISLSVDNSTHSQLLQDILAIYFNSTNPDKFQEFFVEFGATDGITLSNTFQLEKKFGWQGILAEPGKNWQRSLQENRTCSIDQRAVWVSTGDVLSFQENKIGELSTLSKYNFKRSENSCGKREYDVDTVSLIDLLKQHSAPRNIGYLSVDTEGSEYEIIKAFDFSQFRFGFISIEHNHSQNRKLVYEILKSNGYTRVMSDFSAWDDFYIPNEHPLCGHFGTN